MKRQGKERPAYIKRKFTIKKPEFRSFHSLIHMLTSLPFNAIRGSLLVSKKPNKSSHTKISCPDALQI